ncbi:MAG TPA: WbqC family protein, partial [Chitinophagaceae bacterium]|nr:WbqC family protein [Chitinophagaceae bacterium]
PPGGMAIYKKEHFKEQGIDLKFLQPLLSEYPQCNGSFHPGLSVIDIMMFNPPSAINKMMEDFKLL